MKVVGSIVFTFCDKFYKNVSRLSSDASVWPISGSEWRKCWASVYCAE